MTRYDRPRSLREALTLRRVHPTALVVAGGTDLMVGLDSRPAPSGLLDVFGLPELVGVACRGDWLRIGAATPYAVLRDHAEVAEIAPALAACVREIGAVPIQNRGTPGGNVVTSSPVGDTLPVWLALDARVELASADQTRTVAYVDFCTGYRTTVLAADELVTAIEVPLAVARRRQTWRKVGTRQAQAISKVSLACSAELRRGRIELLRVAAGAVADRPIRLHAVEQALVGQRPTPTVASHAAELARQHLTPIDDVRSSAEYRRAVAANLVRSFVLSLSAERPTL